MVIFGWITALSSLKPFCQRLLFCFVFVFGCCCCCLFCGFFFCLFVFIKLWTPPFLDPVRSRHRSAEHFPASWRPLKSIWFIAGRIPQKNSNYLTHESQTTLLGCNDIHNFKWCREASGQTWYLRSLCNDPLTLWCILLQLQLVKWMAKQEYTGHL